MTMLNLFFLVWFLHIVASLQYEAYTKNTSYLDTNPIERLISLLNSIKGIYRYSPMRPSTTKLPITVNVGTQQVASSTISSYQDGIKEEPHDVDGFGAPPISARTGYFQRNINGSTFHMSLNNINQNDIDGFGAPTNSSRNRQYQHNVDGSTFHMDLNNVNHDIIELSFDSESEDNPSCDDSDKQLVLYDPSVHGGGEIECCPDPISYQPASYQPISYQPPHISRNNFRNQLQSVLPAVGAYTVQCANCFKWRLVPTQEKYEEIREHITQYPFVCERALEWGSDVSCDDPPDIEQDGSRLWAIDKPNIAQTPPGWQRDLRIRSEGSTKFGDIYYTSPTGVTLRSKPEVEKYLFQHPEYMEQGVSLAQFSFRTPKPLQENYVRKRPSRAAAIQDCNFMGMPGSVEPLSARSMALPGPEQNTDLQLGMPGFSTPYAFNPSPKKPRSSPAKRRHNFDLMLKHHEM